MLLTLEDIDRLVENKHMADYFEEVIKEYKKLSIEKDITEEP